MDSATRRQSLPSWLKYESDYQQPNISNPALCNAVPCGAVRTQSIILVLVL